MSASCDAGTYATPSSESRASLGMFNRWNPDVFVDLHTTDGSYHGYALTYSPSLNPAGDVGPFSGGAYTRDSILPELRRRVRVRRGYETFDYGNFASQDSVEKGWFTYEHYPRYGTNYYALRGRISVLSEAFSHDPFNRRVASTYAFVSELLTMIGERGARIRALSARSDSAVLAWGRGGSSVQIPIRGDMTKTPYMGDVLVETLLRTGDSVRTRPVCRGRDRSTAADGCGSRADLSGAANRPPHCGGSRKSFRRAWPVRDQCHQPAAPLPCHDVF